MSVAKITEIQSTSTKSFDDAIQAGIARASKTLRNLTGAWERTTFRFPNDPVRAERELCAGER